MPDTTARDQLAALLAEQLYDRGEYVAAWPADERDLHRDHTQWTDWLDRTEKVQALRYRKAADALLAAVLRSPARVIDTVEELERAALGTIVRTADGDAAVCRTTLGSLGRTRWFLDGEQGEQPASALARPVRVLWTPGDPERPPTATLAARNDGSDLVGKPVGYITGYRNADGDWQIPFDGTPFATRDEAAADARAALTELPGVDWRALTVYDETGEPYRAGER